MGAESTSLTNAILVTGFEPFDERGYNTSSAVLPLLPDRVGERCVVTAELPVDWLAAGPAIRDLVARYRPSVALGLGMSRASHLQLEGIAVNKCGADRLDNGGKGPPSEKIRPDGPDTYPTGLPITEIHDALQKAHLPVKVSDSAGDYLCNLCFYTLMDCSHRLGTVERAGFVHVPPLESDGGWELHRLRGALVEILSTL